MARFSRAHELASAVLAMMSSIRTSQSARVLSITDTSVLRPEEYAASDASAAMRARGTTSWRSDSTRVRSALTISRATDASLDHSPHGLQIGACHALHRLCLGHTGLQSITPNRYADAEHDHRPRSLRHSG